MEHIHDVIIIGGGPAGYTAALYAARAGLDTVVIEKMSVGGQMATTGKIENYPGFEDGIEGFDLGMRMQAGAERFGARTEYAQVTKTSLAGEIKRVFTDFGELLSRTVIIATGADPRKLGVKDEEQLMGNGVHYCAHCDGRFYKDKTVMVVGGGNSAASDALYLSRLAKKVYVVHRRDTLRATKIYHQPLMKAENVEFLWNSAVSEFSVNEKLESVKVKDVISGEEQSVTVDGVFVSIGRKPATELFKDELELDENGYIVAEESTKTNISGVYAVGDVRTKELRQIVTAVADGAVAADQAEKYLSEI